MTEQLRNQPETTLAQALAASVGATTLNVAATTGFPTTATFRVLLETPEGYSSPAAELCTVTAVDGAAWTVTRAAEALAGDQTRYAFPIGSVVTGVLTAAALAAYASEIGGGAELETSANPTALGTADPGDADTASASDHVHPTTGLATSGHNHTGVYDPAGTASSAVASHAAAGDPHADYATDADLTTHAGTPHGATDLEGLSDVDLSAPADGQVLAYDGSQWINEAPAGGGGPTALDDLTDVDLASPTEDDVLVFDGTSWVNAPPAGGGGATDLEGLSDVDLTTPADGQLLTYDGAQWVNEAPAAHDHDADYEAAGAVATHAAAGNPHADYATDADLAGHTGNTSNPHAVTKAQVGLGSVPNTDATARANHTGTQTAATVSDFDTQVRTNRLDQLATPTADVAIGGRKLTGLADPSAMQDAATKAYADSLGGSGVLTRLSSSYTTASLATNATETGLITLAKGYRLLKITTDRPARVRLYDTAAHRTADAARPIGTDPTGDHGVMLEFVSTALLLTAALSPQVDGYNDEATPSDQIPLSITNKDATTGTVTVTFVYYQTEPVGGIAGAAGQVWGFGTALVAAVDGHVGDSDTISIGATMPDTDYAITLGGWIGGTPNVWRWSNKTTTTFDLTVVRADNAAFTADANLHCDWAVIR